jgi:hypothetical protein
MTLQPWRGELQSINISDPIDDVLAHVRRKGVRLWAEDGKLQYEAPKGSLTPQEIARLRDSKRLIIALLEKTAREQVPALKLEPRNPQAEIPLTYSQLAYWRLCRESQRGSLRQIASATRLRGALSLDALQQSLSELVRHHEVLRTRIVSRDDGLWQLIDGFRNYEIGRIDLMQLPDGVRENEVSRIMTSLMLEPVDLAVGPLFGVRLVRMREDEHVLLVAMEHMISDAASMNIFLRDLITAYGQAVRKKPIALPKIPIQFADYAIHQQKNHQAWIEKHGAYWDRRLAGCRRLTFPESAPDSVVKFSGWGQVLIRIDRELKESLIKWCRFRKTTLVLSVLTVYTALVMRWCHATDAIIQYQTDGRTNPEIEQAIGYFASVLLLRIETFKTDTFIDLLQRITQEYCASCEHADASYLESRGPRPDFTRNTAFNWIPEDWNNSTSVEDERDSIIRSPFHFESPILKYIEFDCEPSMLLFDKGNEIVGCIAFPRNRFSNEIMEQFGRNFLGFLEQLIGHAEQRLQDITLLEVSADAPHRACV